MPNGCWTKISLAYSSGINRKPRSGNLTLRVQRWNLTISDTAPGEVIR
jgi:hypothetical protein